MGTRLLVAVAVLGLLGPACDGSEPPPPPPPTVPESLPPEPQTEQCADLVGSALGLLQGQLDALAGVEASTLLDPAGTLPPMPELDRLAAELAARSDQLCAEGELGTLVAPRLGELQPSTPIAERYVELLAERLSR